MTSPRLVAVLLATLLVVAIPVQTQDVTGAKVKLDEARKALDAATALLTALPVQPGGTTTLVPQGADLQAAINAAKPGDTLTLSRGVTYTGSLTLPVTTGSAYITIRTQGDLGLPAAGQRIGPSSAPVLAKLKSSTSDPAIRTLPGAHHWKLLLLELQANQGGFGDVIRLGDGREAQTTIAQVPHDLVLERLYIHGDVAVGQKRGVALNSASTTIVDSDIREIHVPGQDSQAISGWNGPGPFIITNNYLEAASENLMFGGGDSASALLIPSDIMITRNNLVKPIAWRGRGWAVKNLLELKSARRVTIADNTADWVWADGQVGYAFVVTVRNQDRTAPWSTIEDVLFSRNTVHHMGGGIQILGRDDPGVLSGVMRNVVFRENTFDDVSPALWGGTGRQVYISGGPVNLTLDGNAFTGVGLNTFITFDQPEFPSVGLKVTGNHAQEGAYGVFLSGGTPGIKSLEAAAPGYTWSGNTLVRTSPDNVLYPIPYPVGTIITPGP